MSCQQYKSEFYFSNSSTRCTGSDRWQLLVLNGDCPGKQVDLFLESCLVWRPIVTHYLNLATSSLFSSKYGEFKKNNSQNFVCYIRQPFFFVAKWRKFATIKNDGTTSTVGIQCSWASIFQFLRSDLIVCASFTCAAIADPTQIQVVWSHDITSGETNHTKESTTGGIGRTWCDQG
jgi:hypothetical protein